MSQQLTTTGGELLHSLVINGDLSKMNESQKVSYYLQFCQQLGLNAWTQPFRLLKFQGREVLYATKDATEQLRKIHGISVTEISGQLEPGMTYTVTCKVKDKSGKTDMSTGVVAIEGLKGEALANALMKAETKSKRRATLSICGLSVMDESEIASVDGTVIDITLPKEEPKRPLTEAAFGKGVEKIRGGDHSIIEKLRATFLLSPEQLATLVQLEDANIVTS